MSTAAVNPNAIRRYFIDRIESNMISLDEFNGFHYKKRITHDQVGFVNHPNVIFLIFYHFIYRGQVDVLPDDK